MDLPVILHCNYVEQGQSIEQMCRLAKRWGFDGIEFRRRSPADLTPEQYLDRIAAAAEKEGLAHISFGGPGANLMLDDPAGRQQEVDSVISFYRHAIKRFKLNVVNTMTGWLADPSKPTGYYETHGSALATDALWQQAVEGFQQIGDAVGEMGFRMAFETHGNYLHDLPKPTRKLVDLIDRPAIGINFDYGNIHLFANAPSLEDAIATCGDKIYMVHLKNSRLVKGLLPHQPVNCGLGEGDINNRAFLRQLKQQGFNGPVVIEAPRPGDREWFAQQDLRYIRSVMQDLALED